MLLGMVHVVRHGTCCQAWYMLPGMVHVARHGTCCQAWYMLPGMVHVARHGTCCQAYHTAHRDQTMLPTLLNTKTDAMK